MATSGFTFQLDAATVQELAAFAFELVTAAALLRYQAQIDIQKLVGVELTVEERKECMRSAFDEALDDLPAENPFREPIRRYVAEVALPITEEEDDPSAPPKLKLVR